MRTIVSTMVLATAVAVAQQETPSAPAKPALPTGVAVELAPSAEVSLKPGSPVRVEALASAKWLQGEALKEFEPGKVYLFECWATWCGPCIAAIPHVNGLHKKYHEKGLRVIGVNVWEDGLEKVEKFVKDKGDGMAYPIAYTGRGSAFEKEWLKPAGIKGIPHAFIVQDGKLLLTSHPAQLTESLIEELLGGGDSAAKAAEKINAGKAAREKSGAVMMAFRQASAKDDTAVMAEKLAEFEKIDAKSPYLDSMRFDLLIARKDWDGASKLIASMPEGPGRQLTLSMTANRVAMRDGDYPADFIKSVASAFDAQIVANTARQNPMEHITLAALQWKGGEKEKAIASAEKASAAATGGNAGRPLPAAPFEKYVKSLRDGTLPTMDEFSGWLRESMQQSGTAGGTRVVPTAKPD